jgi:hypothetical protein
MLGKLIGSVVLWAGIAHAQSAPYVFSQVADLAAIGPPFTAAALNNAGTVVQGVGSDAAQRFEMWPRGGSGAVMLDTSGVFAGFTMLSPIPLNSGGTIAFRGTLDSGAEGIYTYGPGGLRTIAETTGPYSGFGPSPSLPALNNFGQVAFTATLKAGGSGVFLGDGTTTTPLATTASGDATGFAGLAVGLNNRGDAAMVANLAGGGQAILLSTGGAPAVPIADTAGPIASFGSFLNVNDDGLVAFAATLDAGGQSVFVWDGGVLTPIMSSGGQITFVGNQRLNNRGSLSILTTQAGASLAIYVYTPESGLKRLIGAGDSLFGSTIVETGAPMRGVFASVNSFNDLDEVAFETRLADGRWLAVLATPVPEPFTAGLVAMGLAAIGTVVRRQRKAREPTP